jgi:hypothetical protein
VAARRGLALLLILAALSTAREAAAQFGSDLNTYEARYGKPVDVSLTDLLQDPSAYVERAVRTSGRLDLSSERLDSYSLRDTFNNRALVIPVSEVASEFGELARSWIGQTVQVTGIVRETGSVRDFQNDTRIALSIWGFTGPENHARDEKDIQRAPTVTLESLVANPGRHDGQMVRTVGKFRGRNLYGDLPARSQRQSGDWVIKNDLFAVWVEGKKPKGPGFELDAGLKRDTGKWIEVIGRPETQGGVTYIKAVRIALTSAPGPTADAKAPPPPPPRPKVPPVVVFSLPLEGDAVASGGGVVLQFSKDMDEETFKGRVIVRYVRLQPGDRTFDGMKMTYDAGRRALTVDPGDVLRPDREVEVRLLPGIVDIDGLALVPRPGHAAEDAVEVFRYRTGG